ncbi:MAG TPA: hypothetical protein VJP45_06130 [Candidatus Limnocylindria bacterium]|nr:hypothetical protein [Candidatus Limnocylindria bacterium]
MKAEAWISSFTVYSDDEQTAVLLEPRIGGAWWAVVMTRGAARYETVREVRLDSPLDLGALLLATFGESATKGDGA